MLHEIKHSWQFGFKKISSIYLHVFPVFICLFFFFNQSAMLKKGTKKALKEKSLITLLKASLLTEDLIAFGPICLHSI